jgi:hypothetical protein
MCLGFTSGGCCLVVLCPFPFRWSPARGRWWIVIADPNGARVVTRGVVDSECVGRSVMRCDAIRRAGGRPGGEGEDGAET